MNCCPAVITQNDKTSVGRETTSHGYSDPQPIIIISDFHESLTLLSPRKSGLIYVCALVEIPLVQFAI